MKYFRLHAISLTIAIFSFYLLCLPNSVTLEDDGLFLLSAYFNGVSHPPGYPLHSLLGYYFTHLPLANPAFNGHALSAVFSAFSSFLIFLITLKLSTQKDTKILTAYTAAIAFTLSSAVWSQSIITEVYTLSSFLFLCVLFLALKLGSSIREPRFRHNKKTYLFLLGLFTGLALANHWPLFVLGFIGVTFILIRHYASLIKYWHLILLGVLLGLTPHIWLFINSNSDTIIKFFGPIETWREFYEYVARKNYNNSIDFSSTATFYDKISFVFFTLKQLVNQWGLANSLFVPLGLFAFIKLIKKDNGEKKHWYIGILLSYFSASVLLMLILNYNFTLRNQINIQPFLVLAHSLGAIVFAFGVQLFISILQRQTQVDIKIIVISLILLQTLTANGFKNYRANYQWADFYAKQVLDNLEPNAVLFVSGDEAIGPVGYWHLIKGYRPDITLISEGGDVINNTQLFDPRKTPPRERIKIITQYAQESSNPVYFNNNFIKINSDAHWLVFKYNKLVKNEYLRLQPLNEHNKKYLDYIFSDINHTDLWTRQHQKHLRKRAVGHLVLEVEKAKTKNKRLKYITYISKVTRDLNEVTHTLSLLKLLGKTHYLGSEQDIIKLGWLHFKTEADNEHKANFLNLLAQFSYDKGNFDKSLALAKKSISLWETKTNKAFIIIDDIQKQNSKQNIEL